MSTPESNEYSVPETSYSRDIENNVFRGIVIETLSEISSIGLVEGGFFESFVHNPEKARGITIVQDPKTRSLSVKIEVAIQYGASIPAKAEEIQTAVVRNLTAITGIHVAEVHVVFKDIVSNRPPHSPHVPQQLDPHEFEDRFE